VVYRAPAPAVTDDLTLLAVSSEYEYGMPVR